MRYIIDHDLHIHTKISNCSSDPEQIPKNILKYAQENGLKTISVTDHFWDENVLGASDWYEAHHKYSQIVMSKPLPQSDGIDFLFGCETELDKFCTLGLSPARYNDFEIIILPTTHLHMKGFTISVDDYDKPERLAKLWVKRLDAVLDMDLPFHKIGLAHLACDLLATTPEKHAKIFELIPVSEMQRLFKKATEKGAGIEINGGELQMLIGYWDTLVRVYKIAKDCGAKFYYGSDSHHPVAFERIKLFEQFIDLVGLEESDKWILKR